MPLTDDSVAGMTPEVARQMARLRQQFRTARPEWQDCADAEAHIPVQRYFDPGFWQAEVSQLFRSLPLVAAHSSQLLPNSAMTHDSYGVPLLLTRDANGVAHAFLNVCRHRGMRVLASGTQAGANVVCPYHGWTYRLNGELRHMLHAESFDACPAGGRDLVSVPCVERHGLIWVVPQAGASLDLPGFLQALDRELPYFGIGELQHFRTIEADYPANWKLIVDAFLEAYHIRFLHKDTIFPFFTDGITAATQLGPHIQSLVARRTAQAWAEASADGMPQSLQELQQLVTPSHVIFPNTITIFHPDYLSLITVYPTGPESLRWTHRMLIPKDKATPDWAPHWEKTFKLIEQGVFQKEDIAAAVSIQKGLKTGVNQHLSAGRMEQGVGWFHAQVMRHVIGAQ